MTDQDLVLARLRGLIGDQDAARALVVVHQGEPISKARPRLAPGQNRPYTPKRTADAERALAWQFKAAIVGRGPAVCNVVVVAIFYRPDLRRIDADNLMKLVLDAATKAGVWLDDSQVTAHAAVIELDRQHPRTVIAICPYRSSLVRVPSRTQQQQLK